MRTGYFDTPTVGIPTKGCVEAIQHHLSEWSTGDGDHERWEQSVTRSRTLIAGELGCVAENVASLPSITTAVANQARSSIRGGRLLAHRREFRSLLLPALAAVSGDGRSGHDNVRWVDGPYVTRTFTDALESDVSLIVASSVASHDGARLDLAGLAAAATETGADLIADATQGAGLVGLGVPLAELTQVVLAGYKGLGCPRGVAFAASTDRATPYVGAPSPYGMADDDSYGPPIDPLPGMTGMSQSPSWISWIGAEHALADLFDTPLRDREARVLDKAGALAGGLREIGLVTQETDLPSPVITVAVPQAEAWIPELRRRGLVCAARLGRLRLGVNVFTTDRDVEIALDALTQTRTTLSMKG